jgi:hypothetical protein
MNSVLFYHGYQQKYINRIHLLYFGISIYQSIFKSPGHSQYNCSYCHVDGEAEMSLPLIERCVKLL